MLYKYSWNGIWQSNSKNWAGKNWYIRRDDSRSIVRAIGLVMDLKFAGKQKFKLKKIEKLIYVRNINSSFNKKELIENTVEANTYY